MRFALYGFGTTGKYIADHLIDQGHHLEFIIDKNKQAPQYRNIDICTLEALLNENIEDDNIVCVIALHNHYVDLHEINNTLQQIKFNKIISLVQLAKIVPALKLPQSYWFDARFDYKDNVDNIAAFKAILHEQKSKDLIDQIIKYRSEGNLADCPMPSVDDEYVPIDLPKYAEPLRLVDCGAYNGVAIEKFLEAGYRIQHLVAFEPDPINYAALSQKEFATNMSLMLPLGVWSDNTQLYFQQHGAMSSHISDGGDMMIQCVKPDSVLKNFEPNLIKFDVEGAEIEALKGMKEMITKSKPNMCVSLYHLPEHLFEIPLLLHSWKLGYTFYVRVHGFNTFGIVLYALRGE